jgi:hypothetical protein
VATKEVLREIRLVYGQQPYKLVANNKANMNELSKYYSGEQLQLLLKKGDSPYEYVDSVERFNKTCLPPTNAFYSTLKGEGISDEDYEHAQQMWRVFNMKTFRDYHNLYNTVDALQLADVFENFRNTFINSYKSDLVWNYTLPGYAWDVRLQVTAIRLQLLTAMKIVYKFHAEIRGGISSIMH